MIVLVRKLIKSVSMKWTIASALLLVLNQNAWAAPGLEKIEFWDARDNQSTQVVDHSAWQDLLNVYLNDQHPSGVNRFNYKAVSKEDDKKLDKYLDYLQSMNPKQLNSKEQFAYWVNLYNAKTVDYIIRGVQKNNIESIKEIRSLLVVPGPWKRKDLKIQGKKVSLDDIEHGILRPIWLDHRIHFAVNCASIGCPNLMKTAFTSENTETLLEYAQESFLKHPRAVKYENGTLVLTSLMDWYGADFADSKSELLDYLSDHVSEDLLDVFVNDPPIKYEYDWKLNAE